MKFTNKLEIRRACPTNPNASNGTYSSKTLAIAALYYGTTA